MKKKCMAGGGMVRGGMSMADQLRSVRQKMADGGVVIDKAEEALRRSREKFGGAPAEQPRQSPPVQQPAQPRELGISAVVGQVVDRNKQIKDAAEYGDPKKFAEGGIAGQVAAFQNRIPVMAASTWITPPGMMPTEAQGLAASGSLAGGVGALTNAAQLAPVAPTAPGNVFANPSAGNVLAPSGGAQTFAERAQPAGIDPNAAYRPGSAQDPHASGITGSAQRIAGSNATAAALAPNQQAPQIESPMDTTSVRQRRQTRTPGLADGGLVQFAGKGGPRDDKIPVKVAGQEIKVSNGEQAMILPAKTAQNPQAIAAIGGIIANSNDGRSPAMGIAAGGRYAGGALKYPYDGEQPPTAQQIYAGAGRGIGDAIATHAFPSAAGAIQKYGDAAQQAAEQGNYGGAVGQVGRGVVAGGIGVADDVMRSAARVLDPAANALKTLVTGDSSPARPSAERAASHQGLPAATGNEGQQRAIGAANMAPTPDLSQSPGDARFNEATGTLRFTDKNYDPTTQQYPDGGGAITGKNGKTIVLAPQGIASTVGTGPRDAHGNDMTQTLKLRDELNRARADNAWSNVNSVNPAYQQRGIAQLQALTQSGALDSESLRRLGIQQQNAANNPEADRQLKTQQIAKESLALQGAQELNALYAAHQAAKTPDEQARIGEQIRVRVGKDKPDEYAHAQGGTYVDPNNPMVPLKTPDSIYSKRTGLPAGQQQPAILPPRDQLKIGQTYTTAQGPMVWRGNGFEAVKQPQS